MKPVNVLITSIGIMGVFVLVAAFANLQGEPTVKNLNQQGKGFAVVELFTSEGCSSCPPADELVEKIQENSKNKEIYILAFHVDYWDQQGWKDRFSDRAYSDRQREYASLLHLRTVYTPQIVINGASEYVGSDQGSVLNAIAKGLAEPAVDTTGLKLDAKIAGGKLTVKYKGVKASGNSELVLALVQKSAQSSVKAGENSGKNLSHVQIVRQLVQGDLDSKKEMTMKLPADFKEKGWELIGFVQHKNDGHIINAARFNFEDVTLGN